MAETAAEEVLTNEELQRRFAEALGKIQRLADLHDDLDFETKDDAQEELALVEERCATPEGRALFNEEFEGLTTYEATVHMLREQAFYNETIDNLDLIYGDALRYAKMIYKKLGEFAATEESLIEQLIAIGEIKEDIDACKDFDTDTAPDGEKPYSDVPRVEPLLEERDILKFLKKKDKKKS